MDVTASYRAYTNIALIKYWGKRDAELFLPMTSSLSLTLEALYTDTRITMTDSAQADCFILNGQLQDVTATDRISRFLDRFVADASQRPRVLVESINHVPTAAGLASSASAYAALGCAANEYFQTQLSRKELSTLVRQGSGSATRSLFGGFALWHRGTGTDSASSYAEQIDDAQWDIAMIIIVINAGPKRISSREGMIHTMQTSPYYRVWPDVVAEALPAMQEAIAQQDFERVGRLSEHNAMAMHASMIASNPSLTYWEPESLTAMQCVRELRDQGIPCYYTMDAGPNVKVLCRHTQAQAIMQSLSQYFKPDQLILSAPGSDPHPIDWEALYGNV